MEKSQAKKEKANVTLKQILELGAVVALIAFSAKFHTVISSPVTGSYLSQLAIAFMLTLLLLMKLTGPNTEADFYNNYINKKLPHLSIPIRLCLVAMLSAGLGVGLFSVPILLSGVLGYYILGQGIGLAISAVLPYRFLEKHFSKRTSFAVVAVSVIVIIESHLVLVPHYGRLLGDFLLVPEIGLYYLLVCEFLPKMKRTTAKPSQISADLPAAPIISVASLPKSRKKHGILPLLMVLLIPLLLYVALWMDTIPRSLAWVQSLGIVSQREAIATKLKSVGVVIEQGNSVGCGISLVGHTCSGTDSIVVGTNLTAGQVKRPLIDILHSLGYVANDNSVEVGIENFGSYPDGKVQGSANWDTSGQERALAKIGATTTPYKTLIIIGMARAGGEAPIDFQRETVGNSDPRKLPVVNYPRTFFPAWYKKILPSRVITYNTWTVPFTAQTTPLCGNFRVVDENNAPVSISDVPNGMPVTLYTDGSCVAIMYYESQDKAAANPELLNR